MSLVEVSELRFKALPDAPPLDDNPAVRAVSNGRHERGRQCHAPTLGVEW